MAIIRTPHSALTRLHLGATIIDALHVRGIERNTCLSVELDSLICLSRFFYCRQNYGFIDNLRLQQNCLPGWIIDIAKPSLK